MNRYRLEPVRDARTRDERTKRGELAAAVGDATATADDVAAAERRVTAARAAIDDARRGRNAGTLAASSQLVLHDRFLARLRRDLDVAVIEHLRAQAVHAGQLEQIDAARGRLARARADREVIERHFVKWRDEQRKLADRRAD